MSRYDVARCRVCGGWRLERLPCSYCTGHTLELVHLDRYAETYALCAKCGAEWPCPYAQTESES